MKKQIITLGLIVLCCGVNAQKIKKNYDADTIKFQEIEDIQLHKAGNPNKVRPMTTKSNLSLMETPQPVAIVTHEIIEQQQAKQLSDVLQNVNGMYVTSSRGASQDSFGGRGFILGNDNIYKNGSRINSGIFPEVSGLERVEVLKGSNAMLYGNAAAGGILNMITKKPRFSNGGSIGFSAGSWDTYKPTIDIYGPLNKSVAFRVNGAYEKAGSFRDVVESQKHYFNPSFLFNIGTKSQLIIEADYLKHHFTPDFGIGSLTKSDNSYVLNELLPINAFLGANWQYQDVQQVSTNITFNHQFNPNWTLNAVASYQNYTKDYFSTERIQWAEKNNRFEWKRPLNRTYNEQNYESVQVNLNGEFSTGKINHKLLIGADADYNAADAYTYFNPENGKTFGTSYFYNTNGNFDGKLFLDDASTWASGVMPKSEKLEKTRINTRRIGAFVQDFVSLTDKFKIIAGLRWSYLENMPTITTNFKNNWKKVNPVTATSDVALSPKAGLVYMPNDNLSFFATYTNSFVRNAGYTSPNLSNSIDLNNLNNLEKEGLKPTTIDQFEIGAKKNLFRNTVAVNVSAYQILYNKYYQKYWYQNSKGEIITPDANLKEFAGKMRSRGVELDITGNPTKNLSLIGGFSYNNAVYLDTPEKGYIENQRIVRTPSTTANASVFYTFGKGIKGLKIGSGIYFIGGRLAGWNDTKQTNITRNDVSRTFSLKDYNTVFASIGYERKQFSIMLKINNIFNTKNFTVHENYSVNPIAPRNFYLTFNYKL